MTRPEPVLDGARAPYVGSKCRRCRTARIIWCLTAAGRKLAVDPAPTADGTVSVVRVGLDGPVVTVHGGAPPEGLLRYRVHVASCTPPKARKVWR